MAILANSLAGLDRATSTGSIMDYTHVGFQQARVKEDVCGSRQRMSLSIFSPSIRLSPSLPR